MPSIQGSMSIINIIITITVNCVNAVADSLSRNKFYRKYATDDFYIISFLPFFFFFADLMIAV